MDVDLACMTTHERDGVGSPCRSHRECVGDASRFARLVCDDVARLEDTLRLRGRRAGCLVEVVGLAEMQRSAQAMSAMPRNPASTDGRACGDLDEPARVGRRAPRNRARSGRSLRASAGAARAAAPSSPRTRAAGTGRARARSTAPRYRGARLVARDLVAERRGECARLLEPGSTDGRAGERAHDEHRLERAHEDGDCDRKADAEGAVCAAELHQVTRSVPTRSTRTSGDSSS